jgi:hypothetical protein
MRRAAIRSFEAVVPASDRDGRVPQLERVGAAKVLEASDLVEAQAVALAFGDVARVEKASFTQLLG